jgi:hypothetical protein
MTDFKGHCHCGQTEWTATLEKDQQAHILWLVASLMPPILYDGLGDLVLIMR